MRTTSQGRTWVWAIVVVIVTASVGAVIKWVKIRVSEPSTRANVMEAISHVTVRDGDGTTHRLTDRLVLWDDGKSETAQISGIEFKVDTAPDGRKVYHGSLGAVVIRAADGTPIRAYIDEAWKAELEVRKKVSEESVKRLLEERQRAGSR